MKAESGVRTLCQLPEGAVPLDVIEVCGYITVEGKRKYVTRFSGDAPVSTLLGLMRLGEYDILKETDSWSDAEDEPGGG